MLQGISNFTVPNINQMVSGNGKMSLPVNSSSLVYSHLEHVSGVPAPEGTQGITISKLHLLDVLIGQLNQVKTGSVPVNQSKGIDAIIENYRNLIAQTKAASETMPYTPSPGAQAGSLFNFTI